MTLEADWNANVAGLLREVLYKNGKPPKGWSVGQDLRIARRILETGFTNFEPAVRGLKLLYPRANTLKLLAAPKSKEGEWLLTRAVRTYWDHQKKQPSRLKQLGEILNEAQRRGAA